MLELNRNRPFVFTCFLTGHCHLGKHMTKIGLKQNSHYNHRYGYQPPQQGQRRNTFSETNIAG